MLSSREFKCSPKRLPSLIRYRLKVSAFTVMVALFLLFGSAASAELGSMIRNVTVSRSYFDPAKDEKVTVSFETSAAGKLTVLILDRDGYAISALMKSVDTVQGSQRVEWTGKDDEGVVPDEAYSLLIRLETPAGNSEYFPANRAMDHVSIKPEHYTNGSLCYRLDRPSRVHSQAGILEAGVTKKQLESGTNHGVVMKTICDRQVRGAGEVLERWNGYADPEDSGISVADLPNLVVSIAATPLPDNSIIAVGNQARTHLEYVAQRKGQSLFTYKVDHPHHHMGLTTMDDISPKIIVKPLNAVWSASDREWVVTGDALRLAGMLEGPTTDRFSRQPARLMFFADDRMVSAEAKPVSPFEITVPLENLAEGRHLLTANWSSDFGGCAASVIRVRIQKAGQAAGAAKKSEE